MTWANLFSSLLYRKLNQLWYNRLVPEGLACPGGSSPSITAKFGSFFEWAPNLLHYRSANCYLKRRRGIAAACRSEVDNIHSHSCAANNFWSPETTRLIYNFGTILNVKLWFRFLHFHYKYFCLYLCRGKKLER